MTGVADNAMEGTSNAERQLSRNEKVFWYGLAAVTYIAASIVFKSLSNWFMGPLWLVSVIWFGPLLGDAVRQRLARSR